MTQPCAGRVIVEPIIGGAGELHGRDPGDIEVPTVWWCEVDRPAMVLGSRQQPSVLDLERCAREGVDVVRRRSGGGAVLLVPGEVVWIDVLLPPAVEIDGRVVDDPRELMAAVGRWWAEALDGEGELAVHEGGLEPSPWSELVCFAGLGPGEVLDGGRKLVGLSQRRGRWGSRTQGAVHRRVELAETVALLAGRRPDVELPPVASQPGLDAEMLVDRLVAAISAAVTTPAR